MAQLTYGMVGGGPDSNIGVQHRRAISLDDTAQLVAGAFSRAHEKTLETGAQLGLDSQRCYASYQEMARAEAQRPDGIDFVVVVTPNVSHYPICRAFLEAGIHVVCDKPLCITSEEADDLVKLARENDLLFMVTYVYSGHVTAKFIRQLISEGEIGRIRTVMAEYPADYLAYEGEWCGKQGWRCDPALSGPVNCLGDLGTHVEHIVRFMTGLSMTRVLAKLDVVVPERVLDDNDVVMVEYEGGATGVYWSSQVTIGHDNSLRVRIYGDRGSIHWSQENPEVMTVFDVDGIGREIHRGRGIAGAAAAYERLGKGHPEGWFEAMANLYRSFGECVQAKKAGTFTSGMVDFPTVEDGAQGVRFVEACVASNEGGNAWVAV